MRVLIFGRHGQIAQELQKSCASLGEVRAIGSTDVDLSSTSDVTKVIRDYKPSHIINAAAYTAVDKAEQEQQTAFQINGHALGVIGSEAKKINAHVTHFSTDYVFDGSKATSYVEGDKPSPLNVYGESKLMGEKFLAESGVDHIILRVSWVYGATGNNFLNTMLRLGVEREQLSIVADQIGAPTWSRDIADATAHILKDEELVNKSGLYHLASQGECSWFQFASRIFDICRHNDFMLLKVKNIAPISSEDYKSLARRPKNSLMSSKKAQSVFGISLPGWEESLELVLKDKFLK